MKGRKTGGRTASTPNKATSSLREQVEVEAGAPLPVLLTRIGVKAMKEGDHQLAVNALTKAAAYTYPRIQPETPDTVEPLYFPMLLVGPDGMARIPDNWPGPTFRIEREVHHMDGTVTVQDAGPVR